MCTKRGKSKGGEGAAWNISVARGPPPLRGWVYFVTHHLSHTIFHIQLCHTPSFTYNFVTRHLSYTSSSHTIFHKHLCITPSFTHIFVTHHLWHTVFHTQLCHTPSFTYNFVTRHLSYTSSSHTIFHKHLCTHHLSHTSLSHTIFVTHHLSHTIGTSDTGLARVARLDPLGRPGPSRGRRGTWRHGLAFGVAGPNLKGRAPWK